MSNLPQFISYFTQLYSPIYFSLQVSRDVAILTKLPGPKKMAIYGIERVTPIIASLRHVSAILLKFNFDQRIKIGFKLIDMYFFLFHNCSTCSTISNNVHFYSTVQADHVCTPATYAVIIVFISALHSYRRSYLKPFLFRQFFLQS